MLNKEQQGIANALKFDLGEQLHCYGYNSDLMNYFVTFLDDAKVNPEIILEVLEHFRDSVDVNQEYLEQDISDYKSSIGY